MSIEPKKPELLTIGSEFGEGINLVRFEGQLIYHIPDKKSWRDVALHGMNVENVVIGEDLDFPREFDSAPKVKYDPIPMTRSHVSVREQPKWQRASAPDDEDYIQEHGTFIMRPEDPYKMMCDLQTLLLHVDEFNLRQALEHPEWNFDFYEDYYDVDIVYAIDALRESLDGIFL
jgi:hypothetical protein